MLKATLSLESESDASTALDNFAKRLVEAQLGAEGNELQAQVRQIVQSFASNGAKLLAVGSQFSAKRVLTGPRHHVTIVARFGRKPSVLARISRIFKST